MIRLFKIENILEFTMKQVLFSDNPYFVDTIQVSGSPPSSGPKNKKATFSNETLNN